MGLRSRTQNRDRSADSRERGTDKFYHGYTDIYEQIFELVRDEALRILEVGVGGYKDPAAGGESARMWRQYFKNATITAIDLYDKRSHEEDRIRIYQGSQDDQEFLEKVNTESGPFDIIIDDGSHINQHVRSSFRFLFPLLSQGGTYIIEDLAYSYLSEIWRRWR